jgi:hypothetical protein
MSDVHEVTVARIDLDRIPIPVADLSLALLEIIPRDAILPLPHAPEGDAIDREAADLDTTERGSLE